MIFRVDDKVNNHFYIIYRKDTFYLFMYNKIISQRRYDLLMIETLIHIKPLFIRNKLNLHIYL